MIDDDHDDNDNDDGAKWPPKKLKPQVGHLYFFGGKGDYKTNLFLGLLRLT